ncbi:hypothetical protein ANO11243_086700 [Dothideomycetidae sp. 11243]|nr:hypothetical protein ANO11243_086700 [fungal sp. No.11243]
MSKPRLVAIIGATGTGKSELAVSIAKRFNGEILNADAMQLYAGLPVITNKIPVTEQQGIPHHLLGCIGLDAQPWTVSEFVRAAFSIIDEVRSRGRLPILVGGTHYYTQSLLFHDTLAENESSDDEPDPAPDSASEASTKWPILGAPTPDILAKLAEVDPTMAKRWHPNDRRKIQRSLQIYLQTGRPASSIYAEQRERRSVGPTTTSPNAPSGLRCPTLLLWTHASAQALTTRLNKRVDTMLATGLVDEVRTLSSYAATHPSVDTSAGIWVSIGYKEFLPYIVADDADKARALVDAMEATKAATRRYAKRQLRWIRLKLVKALRDDEAVHGKRNGGLYVLDSSDVQRYGEDVIAPAAELVQRFLAEEDMPDPLSFGGDLAIEMLSATPEKKSEPWVTQTCDVCGMVGTTESDWRQHVAGRKHKKLVAKAKREQQLKDLQAPGA